MTQFTTIIFDVGGVIFRAADGPLLRVKWAPKCNLSHDEFDDIVFRDPNYWPASVGKITREELWAAKNEKLKLSPADLAELQAEYWNGRWDAELLDFIRTDLWGTYKLGILSDATSGAREKVGEFVDFSMFDTVVFSYEVGMCKPDPDIYKLTLERLRAEPAETVFIDDGLHKIEGARAIGIHGILYTDFPQFLTSLGSLLK